VHRVLRPDGTLWLNLGDSYSAGGHGGGGSFMDMRGGDGSPSSGAWAHRKEKKGWRSPTDGLKPKDLVGMPWRVAFALQADGWWLRQDIIWSKPNPMPESVTDRCTKAHEYIFMFSKSARYFYDAEAVKEPMKDVSLQRLSQPNVFDQPGGPKDPKSGNRSHRKAINNQAERLVKHEKWKTRFEGWDEFDKSLGRNKRSVWEVATSPFPEAHFATFPPELIEPCIKAGTSEHGCCAKCGAPWPRVIAKKFVPQQDVGEQRGVRGAEDQKPMDESNGWEGFPRGSAATATLRWQPICKCDAAIVPCTVLDPFGGAGTAGLVADRLQRNAILVELNPDYVAMAERRIRNDAPLFATAAATFDLREAGRNALHDQERREGQ
jgi:DNA modification methylase